MADVDIERLLYDGQLRRKLLKKDLRAHRQNYHGAEEVRVLIDRIAKAPKFIKLTTRILMTAVEIDPHIEYARQQEM